MYSKCIFFTIVILLLASSSPAEIKNTPSIQYEKGEYILILPQDMRRSLKTYNPQFRHWKTKDYTQMIIHDSNPKSKTQAPFALIIDVNQDNRLDVIIDGFNGSEPEIICILSLEDSYKTLHVDTWHYESNPKELKNYNEGILDIGFNYYLWPNENRDQYPDTIFTIGIPQQSDANGNLLNDGGMIDYLFQNGKFIQHISQF
jgi:hypothetical protein